VQGHSHQATNEGTVSECTRVAASTAFDWNQLATLHRLTNCPAEGLLALPQLRITWLPSIGVSLIDQLWLALVSTNTSASQSFRSR